MTSFLHISNKYYDLDYFCIQTCIGLIDIKNNMRYGDYVRHSKKACISSVLLEPNSPSNRKCQVQSAQLLLREI
jgi:hypothetical protein